jgi:multicomponent K+:H+ antiporter subunit G
MTEAVSMPSIETVLVAAFIVVGAVFTLIGSLGLVRLQNFYQRVHAPTLGTTLGTVFIAGASMIYFSVTGGRLVIHEFLIVVLVTVTTPVSLMILVRAALLRERPEKTENHPGRSA